MEVTPNFVKMCFNRFRYISRAPLKNPDVANLQQASGAPGGGHGGADKSSRSSRMMRPSVQGLVIEEEEELGRRGSATDSTGVYYERGKRRKSSGEYAQYDNFLNGEKKSHGLSGILSGLS